MKTFLALLLCCFSCHAATLAERAALWTNGFFIAFCGDSITEGHNGYNSVIGGGPSGNTNHNIADMVRVACSYQITATNFGLGGQKWIGINTNAQRALETKPKYVFVRCGVNDVLYNTDWSSINSSLNEVYATITASNSIMVLQDVMPWTDGALDIQAYRLRNLNTNLHSWAASNGVWMIQDHDYFGQVRPATGLLDDLKTEFNDDGVHITDAAYVLWSQILYTNIMWMECWYTNRINNMRVGTLKIGP